MLDIGTPRSFAFIHQTNTFYCNEKHFSSILWVCFFFALSDTVEGILLRSGLSLLFSTPTPTHTPAFLTP